MASEKTVELVTLFIPKSQEIISDIEIDVAQRAQEELINQPDHLYSWIIMSGNQSK